MRLGENIFENVPEPVDFRAVHTTYRWKGDTPIMQRTSAWDGSGISTARLAILPGLTHYNIFLSRLLATTVTSFLDAQSRNAR
jgi:hypothetical protein